MPIRKAEAEWKGGLKDGKGNLKLGSGAFEGPYSFRDRFEDGTNTNPEELIGAAHAGCFSMALSADLTAAGKPPERIHTVASVSLDKVADGFAITKIDLVTEAKVPGLTAAEFQQRAEGAKKNCPVSKALAGTQITLKATLL
ncbi:MAG TPA: OsmC family protein [Candidatus Angelobacter sp.]|nr:OsmC family protein [Candidatus Angelobacter sp.]